MRLKVDQRPARIELIPMIDIIFLLLVFFIYSMLSMVVYRGIPVHLPTAESGENEQRQVLVITIDEKGGVYFDKEAISTDRLLERLKEAWVVTPEKAVVIAGHQDSPYRVFVDVLDQVRLAGFQTVSIEAKPRKKP